MWDVCDDEALVGGSLFVVAWGLPAQGVQAADMTVFGIRCDSGGGFFTIDTRAKTVRWEKEPAARAGRSTPLFKTTPYSLHEKVLFDWDDTVENGTKVHYDWSREDGTLSVTYHYPNTAKDQDKSAQYSCAMAEPETSK